MLIFYKKLILSVISISFIYSLSAKAFLTEDTVQNSIDTKLSKIDSPTHVEFYTGFLSKISYAGRYYGTSGIGLYPTLTFKHKSGFEAAVSNNIWTGFSPVFNQSEVNLGFSKSLFSWFGTGISYTRTFMYYGSDSDKMAMNNAINLDLGLYLSWANIGVDYSYMFGYDKASALHIGMSRDFSIYKFLGSDKFSISPGIGGYWAPQTIFYHYFSKNAVKAINRGKSLSKGAGKGKNTSSTAPYQESTALQALDYQINFPVNYRIGHLVFELAYHLDFPMNLPADYLYGSAPLSTISGYIKYIF